MADDKGKGEPDWYGDGLRFTCTQCGKCCTGAGFVWISAVEMAELAVLLGTTLDRFVQKYVWMVDDEYVLKKHPNGTDCVFLKDGKCTAYEARPSQCRSFPFWRQNLDSAESWRQAAEKCEGISDASPVVSPEDIRKQLNLID